MPMTPAQQQLARKMDLLATLSNDAPSTDGMNFEGTQWRVPARYEHDLEGAANDFVSMVRSYEETIELVRLYNFRPYDGAHATYRMLIDFFGYAQGIKQGKNPPSEISVPIGFLDGILQHVSVPWGMMRLPLENATLTIGSTSSRGGVEQFVLTIQGKKKYHRYFDGFLNAVEAYLKGNSIYAGKVMNGRFEFLDIEKVDPSKFVYTEQTWAEAGAFVFSPLQPPCGDRQSQAVPASSHHPRRLLRWRQDRDAVRRSQGGVGQRMDIVPVRTRSRRPTRHAACCVPVRRARASDLLRLRGHRHVLQARQRRLEHQAARPVRLGAPQGRTRSSWWRRPTTSPTSRRG